MADARKTGRIVRSIHIDHKGNPSFEYGPAVVEQREPLLDQNALANQWTYIYFIGADDGPVKIGTSAWPETRLRDLQTGYPYQLHLLAKCCGGEEMEARLHAFFKNERLLGEWFKRSPQICKFIDMIACGVGFSIAIEHCRVTDGARTGAQSAARTTKRAPHPGKNRQEPIIRRSVLALPHYVLRKPSKAGGWAHFLNPPTWARAQGCPLHNEPLGTDYDAAVRRAETVLLPAFDSWRSGGAT